MTPTRQDVIFLFDVDNTLLDNDRGASATLDAHLIASDFGADAADALLEHLRRRCAASWATPTTSARSQRYRLEPTARPAAAVDVVASCWTIRSPSGCIRARSTRGAVRALGAHRDPVRRRRGVPAAQGGALGPVARRSDGRVLIYIHKERELDDGRALYPAEHYVMVDDKLRILAAVKAIWGDRASRPCSSRQGHYAPRRRRCVASYAAGGCRRRAHRRPARLRLSRCPGRRGRAGSDRKERHEGDSTASRSRPEPLARQHHPRAADQRHAEALHRRVLGHRAHLEPDDLRPCDRRTATLYDDAIRRKTSAGHVAARRCSSSSRSRI